MKKIYLSNYCVMFQDNAWLEGCIRSFSDFPVGVEFATSWTTPGFYENLERQITAFADIPTTLHAPFVEECTVPGSAEERFMQERYQYACDLYPRFGATSMVMHTHEGGFLPEERAARQKRSLEVVRDWTDRMIRQGIHVTVENVGFPLKHSVLFDQEEFAALFDQLPPEVGCLIDTGHALLNHWDIPALIRRLGNRVRGYHLNNNDGLHDSHYPIYDPEGVCPPEEMDEILRTIAAYSPEADLVLEYAPGPKVSVERMHSDIRKVADMTETRR